MTFPNVGQIYVDTEEKSAHISVLREGKPDLRVTVNGKGEILIADRWGAAHEVKYELDGDGKVVNAQ